MKIVYPVLVVISLLLSGCEPADDASVEREYHANGDVQTVFENDSEGVNVIFLGDGFVRKDLTEGGIYEQSGISIINHLFTVPPFSTYKEYFNAYIVYAESEDEYIRQPNLPNETVFGTGIREDRSMYLNNAGACFRYARNAVNYDTDKVHIVIVLANHHQRGGVASQGVAVTSQRSKEHLAVHEIGHTFANLADEYINTDRERDATIDSRPNVDTHNYLDTLKWSHFIGRAGYEAVGAYEGGAYVEQGVWRPEETSLMRGSGVGYFNAPSREAIVKRIFEIKGIPYSLEAFLKKDVIPPPANARIQRFDNGPIQCWTEQ